MRGVPLVPSQPKLMTTVLDSTNNSELVATLEEAARMETVEVNASHNSSVPIAVWTRRNRYRSLKKVTAAVGSMIIIFVVRQP